VEICEALLEHTLHFAACDGALLGAEGPFPHAPCSLLPYPFPAALFTQAQELSVPFNTLVDRCSRDTAWLFKHVRTTVEHDEFTRRLLEIAERVTAEGVAQPLQLSINRSDYMVDQPRADVTPRILQVELNTISVSFPSLSAKMCELHRHSVARLSADFSGLADSARYGELVRGRPSLAAALAATSAADEEKLLPLNPSAKEVAAALAQAHAEYAKLVSGAAGATRLAVLMVVSTVERNVVDQRGVEEELWRAHRVPMVRLPLSAVHASAELSADGRRRLLVSAPLGGQFEVSVAYLRAGYAPADYPSEADWAGRELLERSLAVKCPSVHQQLAGTKKVQQVLALPGELERFVTATEAASLRTCFAALYGLDVDGGAAVDKIVATAVEQSAGFVLKPQREGGGNNLYGAELADALTTMSKEERASFILMERIRPPSHPMPLMREGLLDGGGATCELGVYGVILSDGNKVLANRTAGHLLRVKLDGVDEGGVCAGFAVLSSPLLYS